MERPLIDSLEFKGLSCFINNTSKVFENVDFVFPTSGLFAFKSESGGGKSTLLKILNGLALIQHGDYLINSSSVSEMTFSEFTPYRLQFGFSFDFGGLIHNRTIYQNLSLVLEYHKLFPEREICDRVIDWMSLFGIEKFKDHRPSGVPGAVRKAVCVLRAFIHDPQIYLLDDPTTGLRKDACKALVQIINQKQKERKLILIASEDDSFLGQLNIDGRIQVSSGLIKIEKNETGKISA